MMHFYNLGYISHYRRVPDGGMGMEIDRLLSPSAELPIK